jgi:hypothetical protein
VAELGPLAITAHNGEQAAYLVRSRAEQRGVAVRAVEVEPGSGGVWMVTVTVDDDAAARLVAAALDEDTQVLHLRDLRRRPRPSGE